MLVNAAEKVATELRKKIQLQAPGTKLPSVRSLMRRYNASLHSTNLALRQLQSEELIETRKGSGIYINSQKGVRYIELHRPLYPSTRLDTKELSLGRAFEEVGWKLVVRRHPVSLDDPELSHNPKISAHIVMLAASSSFFQQAREQGIPILAYGRTTESPHIDYVTGNDLQCLSMLVKHLRDAGHQRLAFLANEPATPHMTRRSDLFVNICSILEMPPPILIDCGTQPGENSMLKAYSGIQTHLKQSGRRPDFTGIITASPPGIISVLRALHEAGLKVPRDCSVASFGLDSQNALHIPSITEAGIDEDDWGRSAVQALTQRFDHPDSPRIGLEIMPKLIVRESTGSAR